MVALLVGSVVVIVSAAGLAWALFWRDGGVQPAMAGPAGQSAPVDTPSAELQDRIGARPASYRTSTRTKVRAALLLMLAVVTVAAMVGVALSIIVVAAGLLVS
jgi:predicted metal-binding membrane protein